MARVLFYDPFLEVLGGGEKVLLSILEDVAASGRHDVVVMSPTRPASARWRRLGIEVDPASIRWRAAGPLSVTPLSSGADLLVSLVNHFPPLSLARHAAAILQFPFARLRDGGRLRAVERRLRLRSTQRIVCYSTFVAAEIRRRLEVGDPVVINPPVDLPDGPAPDPSAKERAVIAVGRFFPAADQNNKKHEVLIDAWRRLQADPTAAGWTLHLAGGVRDDSSSRRHLDALRERARGTSIVFHPNAPADELRELYRRSALFWHATGFGETEPERYEHFGITTVEAMARGCVPIVIGLGGQLEIVHDGENGRLWHTVDELVATTRELIGDQEQSHRLAGEAVRSSRRFGKPRFLAAVRAQILEPAGVDVG